jgi:hypothetical protein
MANEFEEKFSLFKPEKKEIQTIIKEDFTDYDLGDKNLNLIRTLFTFHIGDTGLILDLSEMKIVSEITVTVAAGKNLALENNFFAKMFTNMTLKNKSQIIDNIEHIDEHDTFVKLFSYFHIQKIIQKLMDV